MAGYVEAPVQPPWHALSIEDVLQRLRSRWEGLSDGEAAARRQQLGPNALSTAPGPSLGGLALKQIRSPLIYMLLAAAAISALAGPEHLVDAGVILAVVVLNTIVGVIQEWRAEKALEALQRLAAPVARVIRASTVEEIPASEVVPGDVLLLESGDAVAADARLLEGRELQVDESALTGESTPVSKSVEPVPVRMVMADRADMLWMSTAITSGRGRAVVVATGMQTIMGEIANEVRGVRREATPLQRRLTQLSTTLGLLAIVLSVLIFVLGLLRGIPVLEMLLFAVATAVSAIPEGLPAVISIVLALGVQRMVRRHAILRRLPAVETLGSTTVICTDKTGTLTRNEMTVTHLWAGGVTFAASGTGFVPEGTIVPVSRLDSPRAAQADLDALLLAGCLVNNAVLERVEDGSWRVIGDPTEGALLIAARKGEMFPSEVSYENPRISEVPFSSVTKYMATLHRPRGGHHPPVLFVKGAPERILDFCTHLLVKGKREPLTEAWRQRIKEADREFASQGLRVLAGAHREMPLKQEEIHPQEVEHDLVFSGLWGMFDPPRPEALSAVRTAQAAGIHVKMITGDHRVTATAIARQVGIAGEGDETITGEELANLPDAELQERIGAIAVFARVAPADKLRIINALQANDEIVAMTGDGVNDAPALKSADIGVAMGVTGTEVAKEAADMVLTDDNFATIVNAVEEGRIIFANLRKVVFFLVTTNLGEIITLTLCLLIGLPLPLTAVMILWVNLVTDGTCTAPLGMEPGNPAILTLPPRSPRAGIIDRVMARRMLLLALWMAAGTLGIYIYALRTYNHAHAQTLAFTTLVAFQWFQALNARSFLLSVFQIGFFRNPWLLGGIALSVGLQLLVLYVPALRAIFRTNPLSLRDWLIILLVAGSIFVVVELAKWLRGRRTVQMGEAGVQSS